MTTTGTCSSSCRSPPNTRLPLPQPFSSGQPAMSFLLPANARPESRPRNWFVQYPHRSSIFLGILPTRVLALFSDGRRLGIKKALRNNNIRRDSKPSATSRRVAIYPLDDSLSVRLVDSLCFAVIFPRPRTLYIPVSFFPFTWWVSR